MPSVCHSYVLACHPYVTFMYSYVLRVSLVCYPYVTRMYSYVLRMSLVCGFTMNQSFLSLSLLAVLSLPFKIYYQRVTLIHNSVDYRAFNKYVNIANVLTTTNTLIITLKN